jgi:hypothetical protein
MTHELPRPDLSRFSPLSAETVLLCRLSISKRASSAESQRKALRDVLPPDRFDHALATLVGAGQASQGKTVTLTAAGQQSAKKALGADVGVPWEKLWKRRLPLMVLGLAPDDREVRMRYAKADALVAATIAVAFDLPADNKASKQAVGGELVWQVLRATLPDLVGRGPFPVLDKLGRVESALLGGLAQRPPGKDPMATLAAATLGSSDAGADALRKQLVALGVERAAGRQPASDGFAARIKQVAATLHTPPFQGRVAIAQVYDAFGRDFPDAGSLDSFKGRLVEAAREGQLHLARLDMPEHMDGELRQRSQAEWGSDQVHFIVTEWK